MATSKKTDQKQPEAEAPQNAANGVPPEAAASEAADDIASAFERSRRELNDTVGRLRQEIAEIDVAQARQRAGQWASDNPTLAIALALGAGLLAGRALYEALKPPPPPTFQERLRLQGRAAASQARRYAHDVGDVVSGRAADFSDEIVRRARELSDDVSRRAREIGEDVTRRAAEAVAATSEQASEFGEVAAHRSGEVAHALHEAAEDLAQTVQRKAGHGRDVADALLGAAKSITAAFVIKKATDWLRQMR